MAENKERIAELEKQLAEAREERDQALHHLAVEMAKNNSARQEGMREALAIAEKHCSPGDALTKPNYTEFAIANEIKRAAAAKKEVQPVPDDITVKTSGPETGATLEGASAGVAQEGWIKCSERLPDTLMTVWVNAKARGEECYQMVALYCEDHEGKHFWSDGHKLHVTHWRELPAPPETLKRMAK